MAWDSEGPALAIVTALAAVRGPNGEKFGGVQIGVPEATAKQVYASVTAGGQGLPQSRAGIWRREARYMLTLSYRLDGAEAAAEQVLMRLLDAAEIALLSDRSLGGRVSEMDLDVTLADTPQYMNWTGREYREYPVLITVWQEQAITPA